MFMRTGILLAGLAALSLTAASASAGDHGQKRHRHIHNTKVVVNIRLSPQHRRVVRRIGTYSGDVVIIRDRRIGTWSYGTLGTQAPTAEFSNGVRILDVNDEAMRKSCSMEHGVCVIRP